MLPPERPSTATRKIIYGTMYLLKRDAAVPLRFALAGSNQPFFFFSFGLNSESTAFCGSAITSRSSFGPRLRFGVFFVIECYYQPDSQKGVSPGRDSNP